MMKIGNINSVTEAANFLINKVGHHIFVILSTMSQVNQATSGMPKMPLYLTSMQQTTPLETKS
jgi:hypothetical protein